MSSTSGEGQGARPDRPGWYPDPREPDRFRHWDGERWNELSSSRPFVTDEAEASSTRRAVPWPVPAGAAALVVALVALGVWALGGDDETAGPTTTTTATTAATAAIDTADPNDPAEPAPDGGDPGEGDAPGDGPTEGPVAPPAAPPPDVDPTAPCTAPADVLLERLRAHPPLEPFAATLGIDDIRCSGRWATAVAMAEGTDASLAVFETDGQDWTFLLLGSAAPCTGLGIPPEAEQQLGCDFGPEQ